jgi:hypothetical protein
MVCLFLPAVAAAELQIIQMTPAQLWRRVEFQIANGPAASNPFDPAIIQMDGTFTSPSGRTITVPAFWFQDYRRGLSGGSESLITVGSPGWRLRFAAPEPGPYSLTVTVSTNGQPCGVPAAASFVVPTVAPEPGAGYVRVAPDRQYFETADGEPLRLIGHNVCWHHGRGTYDYDDWFGAMNVAGENFARLWMCPWAFNLEADAHSLTRYRLDSAWQLDYVFDLAGQKGIYLLLCLDYHGMYEVEPDFWGGNNLWASNPYNKANGGPCLNQNGFFTNETAHVLYQKRLRYLVARYGYSPNLLAWEFFNEIDNVYRYLVPKDVAAWHGLMGDWLHHNDPFGHLVTTSLTGSSDRPELWTLPQLDFAAYHSYNEAKPALKLEAISQSFLQRYAKPVMIGELGTDFRGWGRTNDPHLRGLRQGIWGGALGGSVGTGMSWWWENIHSEDVYPLYSGLASILQRTGWGRGVWTNVAFQTSGAAPATVGDLIPGGTAFDSHLRLNGSWGGSFRGRLALPDSAAAEDSASLLNGFVHGSAHADLKTPFQLSAWLTHDARLTLHLNSVSSGSTLLVRADGVTHYRTNLPNLDGTYNVNNEYNLDISVGIPAGKRLIEVSNPGNDWFFLDWVRLERILPATYSGDWQPSPDAIGLRGPHESLLYVVAPGASFPAGATNPTLPSQLGQKITLTGWPAGRFYAEWYDPPTGTPVGVSQATTTNGLLNLIMPDFREDLAAVLYSPPSLTPVNLTQPDGFTFRLDSETGGVYLIQRSVDLSSWKTFLALTNVHGTSILTDPSAATERAFFRAIRAPE